MRAGLALAAVGVAPRQIDRLRRASGVILVATGMASCHAGPLSIPCASILALQPTMIAGDALTLLGAPSLRLPLTQCRFSGPAQSGECWFYRLDRPRNRMVLQVVFVDGALMEAKLERVQLFADRNAILFRTTTQGVAESDDFKKVLSCDR